MQTQTPHSHTLILLLALLCALNASARDSYAGPLDPPVGPVAPTYKTLTEVEPRTAINATNTPGDDDITPSLFKITQPGSYYLAGNITGVANKHGIEIAASGVTLDLNGFDLAGVPAMGAFDGVSATVAGLRNIAVVNGSVRNWGGEGVDLLTASTINCHVADLLASGNTGNGIRAGSGCTVSNCSAFQNVSNGINAGFGCTVSNCSATQNDGTGINAGSGCTVSNCSAFQNVGSGIIANNGGTVSNCSAYSNAVNGITTGDGGTVSNCSASQNTGNGISAARGCTVSNCSAYSNTGNGIIATFGSTIADCTALFNTLDGIMCSSSCVIHGNTCTSNGNGGDGAGIHATSNDNRIEGNTCTTADRGIDVDSTGNIIVRNTCSGNSTNYTVAIGNVCLVVNAATNAVAINGSSGGVAPGSTDPNANFSY